MADNKAHLRKKADEILQEYRIVLPGTQALLGFQLIAFFNSVFIDLPILLQYIHFASFILTVISTIILIAPVAFQQIGEGGHTTGQFLRYARKMLNSAMFMVLLALTGETYVVAESISFPQAAAELFTALVLLTGVTFWYVYVLIRNKINSDGVR